MTNIKDIAKRTGYSVSTISRVINNYPYVDQQKREEILSVMKELNYVPNQTARNLSFGKTRNIGVVVPYTNHPYYDQLLSGITEAAFLHHYKVTLLPTNYDKEVEQRYFEEFSAKAFDGLIVTSRANELDLLLTYCSCGPIIFCEDIGTTAAGQVFIDREASFRETLVYLKAHGVETIGLTLGRTGKLSTNARLTIQVCREIYPHFDEANIYWNCETAEDGSRAAAFFKEKRVDGVLTNGDEAAAGLVKNSQPPLIVVGQENLFISEAMEFSTIDHQLIQCGKVAFEMFYEGKLERKKMPYRFIKRGI